MHAILGQTRAIDTLQSALKSDRLHHAWIFHGQAGVGKFTTALAFAKTILCESPQTDSHGLATPCGQCESCRLAAANSHPDLHIVTKELALYSDNKQMRDRKLITLPVEILEHYLIGPAHRSATLRRGKVFVVDEAELINPIGQNKLLKTLEEPPAGTVMILVTSAADRLLPTIRSRCQSVAFASLPEEVLTQWLDKQGQTILPEHRRWLLDFADGSLGRLQNALNYELWTWARPILEGLEAMQGPKYPVALGKTMRDAIEDIAQKRVAELDNASKDAANRVGAAMIWSLVARQARKKLAQITGAGDANEPTVMETAVRPWLVVIESIRQAEADLSANVNLSMICDRMALAMRRGRC